MQLVGCGWSVGNAWLIGWLLVVGCGLWVVGCEVVVVVAFVVAFVVVLALQLEMMFVVGVGVDIGIDH